MVADRAAGAFQVHRDPRNVDVVVRPVHLDAAGVAVEVPDLRSGLHHLVAGLRRIPVEVPDPSVEVAQAPAGPPNLPDQQDNLPVDPRNLATKVCHFRAKSSNRCIGFTVLVLVLFTRRPC